MKHLSYILIILLISCSKNKEQQITNEPTSDTKEEAIANPNWYAEARCFLDGPTGAFDDLAVKDPSIVYSGGRYHLFYTGRDNGTGGLWRMGDANATSIAGFKTAGRTSMSALNAGS